MSGNGAPRAPEHALELIGCSVAYPGGTPVLSDASLTVRAGECVGLTGPSGSGKSTALLLLSGLLPRDVDADVSGEALLFGDPVASLPLFELVQRVGIVFQEPDAQLFSPTVEDEVAFGPENLCLPQEEIEARVAEALSRTGIEALRLSSPAFLSGGQKQLAALAAALALRPRALLLDEALSQLDDDATSRIKSVLRELVLEGVAVLMVEHDSDNFDVCDRVLSLTNGRIIPAEGA